MPTTSHDLGLSIPSSLADEAVTFVAEHLSAYMFNHCARCFLYVAPTARAANLVPGEDFDEELVFLICLLHDLGMSEIEDGGQRFELDGADMARRFLLERGVANDRADTVWTGVALHTSDGIAARFALEVAVAQVGIFADGTPAMLSDDAVAAAERAFPRLDVGFRFIEDMLERIARHPESASPVNFPGHIRMLGHTPGEAFDVFDMVAAAGSGDQPAYRRPGAAKPRRAPTTWPDCSASSSTSATSTGCSPSTSPRVS